MQEILERLLEGTATKEDKDEVLKEFKNNEERLAELERIVDFLWFRLDNLKE